MVYMGAEPRESKNSIRVALLKILAKKKKKKIKDPKPKPKHCWLPIAIADLIADKRYEDEDRSAQLCVLRVACCV